MLSLHEKQIKDLEEEEELEEEKPEVIVWYEIEEGEVYYGKEMPDLEEEESEWSAALGVSAWAGLEGVTNFFTS